MAERLAICKRDHDLFRSACVNEPRGNDAMVGALLCAPVDPANAAGVIFFNNVGYLGMCGHGTIGLIASLAHLGRIGPGVHRIETPPGVVETTLHNDGRVSVRNVPAYRHAAHVAVDVPGHGLVHGDVAWGGNWFFLVHDHGQYIHFNNLDRLTDFASRVRAGLGRAGITGKAGAEVDHIELFAHGDGVHSDSKSFVLCPGKAYDRSPCGTGTSASLACLAAEGKLAPGARWRQASVIDSMFEASYRPGPDGTIIPTITGTAHVCAEAKLVLDPKDPFVHGIR